ncbi:MAG: bacteriohemerythrin [Alphaproteobacteria bacterium]|nr:bacteriohemerythrin [Alphaproteobacteria bacterium]
MAKGLLFSGGSLAAKRGELPEARHHDWIVLVVDDDEEVHSVTRMILSRMRYRDRGISVISAYSGAEAEALLRITPDVAVILLDVVMETDDAGLRLVKVIRETLCNAAVRIILRTGQPGQAPEESVIVEYDINDYKEKTELTSQKLTTTVITALRSFADITSLVLSRQGLEKVITACSTLFRKRSMQLFAEGILDQISGILSIGLGGIICVQDRRPGQSDIEPELYVLAASGQYRDATNHTLHGHVASNIEDAVVASMRAKHSIFSKFNLTLYMATPNSSGIVVYFGSERLLDATDRNLVEMFSSNISVEFDNLVVFEQTRRAGRAMAIAMAGAVERKTEDRHAHGMRVARLTEEIASIIYRNGLWEPPVDALFLAELGWAAVLHDVGMIIIPPEVIRKSGPLTPEEYVLVRRHPVVGAEILVTARRLAESNQQLTMAMDIVRYHHERFDGTGYPDRLAGAAIPLSARILAVADVYDSLIHRAPYRDAWPTDLAQAYIRDHAGSQFDPIVVTAFQEVMARRASVVVMTWTEAMSVGSPELDQEHRQLVDLINQVASWNPEVDSIILESMLDEMVTFLGEHFQHEEDLMRLAGYPGLEQHRANHVLVMAQVQGVRRRFTEGFILGAAEQMQTLIALWLHKHVVEDDQLYAPYLAKAAGEQPC